MNRIFTLIMLIFFTFLLKAQEESDIKKNDISMKVGFYTAGSSVDALNNFGLNFLGFNFFYNTKISKVDCPLLFINYKRAITQRWDLEGLLGYEKHSIIMRDSKKNQLASSPSSSFIGMGLGMNFNYIKRKGFQIYSGLNSILLIASTTNKEKDIVKRKNGPLNKKKLLHHLHITTFGVRFGDRFAVNSEIGLGYKGLFNLGASYRF